MGHFGHVQRMLGSVLALTASWCTAWGLQARRQSAELNRQQFGSLSSRATAAIRLHDCILFRLQMDEFLHPLPTTSRTMLALPYRQVAHLLTLCCLSCCVCLQMDEILASTADHIKNFAVVFLVDISEVPDFNTMYELYDPCTTMFFFR